MRTANDYRLYELGKGIFMTDIATNDDLAADGKPNVFSRLSEQNPIIKSD